MLNNFINKFNDPNLVARLQKFFGVEAYDKNTKTSSKISVKNQKNSLFTSNDKSNCSDKEISSENDEKHNDKKTSGFTLENQTYFIKNYIWYYIFLFSTELGDEIFYFTFIPFWFWNVDGAVGRRIVLVWAIIMSFGQVLKDIIRMPRPSCPPVIQLQKKWALEYGMPSTHAMIAVCIPFSIVLFTINRYIYTFIIGFIAATIWCTMICLSRLYLGMHSVADVIVGVILAIIMMIPLVPIIDFMDYYFVTNGWATLLLLLTSILVIVYYPSCDKWTPTRGDTALVVAVVAGVHLGAWLNYKTGILSLPISPPPYRIIWSSYPMFCKMVLRTIIGFAGLITLKTICKILSYKIMCTIFQVKYIDLINSKDCLENKKKIVVDLFYRYISCFIIGFSVIYLLPKIFVIMGIERPNYYTEL